MRLNLTLRQLDCFVTIAKEGHFRRAAERLNIRQPPLTHCIQEMERRLRVQLFTRNNNRIELTEAGRLVFAEAEATLVQAGRVEEVARWAGNGQTGLLRISMDCSVPFIPAVTLATKAFQRDYPGIVLDLVYRGAAQGAEQLGEGRLDICLTRHEPIVLPGIEQMTIARDRLMLVLPTDHPAAGAENVSLRAVANECFIVSRCEQNTLLSATTMHLWAKAEAAPRIALETDHQVSMLSLVSSGFGNAILPSLLRGVHMPNVVWKSIDIDERWTASSIVMLYRSCGSNEKVQSRYIDYIRRFVASPTPDDAIESRQ